MISSRIVLSVLLSLLLVTVSFFASLSNSISMLGVMFVFATSMVFAFVYIGELAPEGHIGVTIGGGFVAVTLNFLLGLALAGIDPFLNYIIILSKAAPVSGLLLIIYIQLVENGFEIELR